MNAAYLDALRAIARPIRAADWPRSLDPMRRLLAELGSPQQQFSSIVVTGSVGKGTTAAHIAHLLQITLTPPLHTIERTGRDRAGVGGEVALYTGPHLHRFRERFVIGGQMISQDEFVEAFAALQAGLSRLAFAYSTFEMATALALWWFARRGVKFAVLETGIGGRWDAVNAAPNVVSVFTPIEMEHAAMLGGSLQTIAWNKAGIMQHGGDALSVPQHPQVAATLEHEAALKDAQLEWVNSSDLPINVLHHLVGDSASPPAVSMPQPIGRRERVTVAGRSVLIDGGHTPLSARFLCDTIGALAPDGQPVRLVIGMLRDKSVGAFLSVFDEPRFHITLTTAPGHRALTSGELASQAHPQHATVEMIPVLHDALAQAATASEPLFVVAGSLRMAAAAREFYGLLSPDDLAEARATRAVFEGDDYLKRLF